MRLLILHEQATLWLSSIQDSAIIYLFYYVQSSLNNMVVIHHPTLTHTNLSMYYTLAFSFMELRTLSLWTVKHSSAIFNKNGYLLSGDRGGQVAVLQIGRSLVRFQMVSLEFFIDIFLPIALCPWGRLSLQKKWVPGAFPGDKGGRCVRLTTLPPSCAVVM